jgi:hypothetical protein
LRKVTISFVMSVCSSPTVRIFMTLNIGTILEKKIRVQYLFRYNAIYEILWKNTLERGRSQMTIWRMRIARCIPKAANTLSE